MSDPPVGIPLAIPSASSKVLASVTGARRCIGGFPALSAVPGQFLIKDLALLGISLWTLVEAWQVSEQRG